MKKILYALLMLICPLMAGMTGCSSSAADDIVGKWKISDYKTDAIFKESEKAQFEEIIEETKQKSLFEFAVDKTFKQENDQYHQKGSWELLADGEQLKQTFEGGKIVLSKIQSLSKSEMVIVQKDDASGSTIVLTLKKQ
ncbi:MAG: hypothetical protein II956_07375 [Bacteroidales bacterium]|nr:hypothetical protein [Bacteroidales bacterium]